MANLKLTVALHYALVSGHPLPYKEWVESRPPVTWGEIPTPARHFPQTLRATFQVESIPSLLKSPLWCEVEAQIDYELVNQNDWGKKQWVNQWKGVFQVPLGVPVLSGISWEWWDFESDWAIVQERGLFIRTIRIQGRLKKPVSSAWRVLKVPIDFQFG